MCLNDRLLETQSSSATTGEHRALPQVPPATVTANNPRPRMNPPPSDEAAAAAEDDHYTDIRGIIASRTRTEDDGHYTDIHSVLGGRRSSYWQVDDPYHYIDIDRRNTQPGNGDQGVSSRAYEGLDPAVLSAHPPPQRRHDYVGLFAAGEQPSGSAQSAQAAVQHGDIEMTDVDAANESGTAVSQLLASSSSSSSYDAIG